MNKPQGALLSKSQPRNAVDFQKEILGYVRNSNGLLAETDSSGLRIVQKIDRKSVYFSNDTLEDVLQRADSENQPFLQINFLSGVKVLLTDTLIGFKPAEGVGLDLSRLPKVVTTPDLQSVLRAIEDSLQDDRQDQDVEILRKVYSSIILGGEKIGLDLSIEKVQFSRLLTTNYRASA